MPFKFEIDHAAARIVKTVWDTYDDQQAIDSMREFSAIDQHKTYDELHDLRGVTSYEVSSRVLADLARESESKEDDNFQGKRVAVVASADLMFGMARLYQGYHGDSKEELRVFRDFAEADAWLSERGT